MTRNPQSDGAFVHAALVNAILNGHDTEGIVSGCTPSVGSGDWDVDVASGTVVSDGEASVSAQTASLTAPSNDADLDSGEARADLVTLDSSGTVQVQEGTAASGNKEPVAPDIPNGQVLVAFVFVDGDATSLSSSDVFDYRVIYDGFSANRRTRVLVEGV